jgi:hypothetical protein
MLHLSKNLSLKEESIAFIRWNAIEEGNYRVVKIFFTGVSDGRNYLDLPRDSDEAKSLAQQLHHFRFFDE